MKTILLLAILFMSCSKQTITPVEKSVTYLIHYHSPKNEFIKTDTSIHWCRVGGEDLKRFERITDRNELICGTNNRMELRIEKVCIKSSFK